MRRLGLIIISGLLILFLCYFSRKNESFTIAERDGVFCNSKIRNTEGDLLPNSVVFVIQGYNYKSTPKFFRDGKDIQPLQYFWDPSATAYYFTLYAPFGVCGSEWILETSDYIMPVVNDGRTGTQLKVDLIRRREDFNRWKIEC